MTALEELEFQLREALPEATIATDAAQQPSGTSFLDVRNGDCAIVIDWRPGGNFGISDASQEGGYGEGADVVASSVQEALEQSLQRLR